MTTIGRALRAQFSHDARNEPFMALGEFRQLQSTATDAMLPDTDPLLGAEWERTVSFATSGTGSYLQDWTSRQASSLSYTYSRTDYLGDTGFDSTTHAVAADYVWRFNRSSAFRTNYLTSAVDIEAAAEPQRVHTAEMGFDYTRRRSATRSISLSGSVGGSYYRALSATTESARDYWSPAGRGSVRVEIGRSWALNADYNRTTAVLDRISVQTFHSDALFLRTGGLIGRELDASVSTGFTRGTAVGGDNDEGGRYTTYVGNAQVRWAFSRHMAVLLGYSYYDYRLTGVATAQRLADDWSQHSVRVGLTVWVPIISGTQTADSRLP